MYDIFYKSHDPKFYITTVSRQFVTKFWILFAPFVLVLSIRVAKICQNFISWPLFARNYKFQHFVADDNFDVQNVYEALVSEHLMKLGIKWMADKLISCSTRFLCVCANFDVKTLSQRKTETSVERRITWTKNKLAEFIICVCYPWC